MKEAQFGNLTMMQFDNSKIGNYNFHLKMKARKNHFYSLLKHDLMTITERLKSPTPSFFKKIRNAGLTLAAISAAILSAPVVWPAMVVTVAGYVGVAGAVASAISQAATEGSSEEAATDDRYGVPLPA